MPPYNRIDPRQYRILAERFAKGDISTEEFMERASVLNWTPGSDAWPVVKDKKKRR